MMDIDEFLDKELDVIDEKKGMEQAEKGGSKADTEHILNKIREHIEKREFLLAEGLYSKIQAKIAEEPVEGKIAIYDKLTAINKSMLKSLNEASIEMDGKVVVIRSLIAKGRDSIRIGKLDSALKVYNEIKDVYSELPDAFIERKRFVQNEVLIYYKQLKDNLDQNAVRKFNNNLRSVMGLIAQARFYLDKRQIGMAAKLYTQCSSLYDNLPDGFLQEKARLYDEVLKLYEAINLHINILGLQKKLQTIEVQQGSRMPVSLRKPNFPSQMNTRSRELLNNKCDGLKKILNPVISPPTPPPIRPGKELELPDIHVPQSAIKKYDIKETPAPSEKKHELAQKRRSEGKKADLNEATKRNIIQRKLERGIFEVNKGMHHKALDDLNELLRLDPENAQARELLEKAKEWKKDANVKQYNIRINKDIEPAMPVRLPKSSEKNPELLETTKGKIVQRKIERSILEIEKGMYHKAFNDLHEALRLDPNNSQAIGLLQRAKEKAR